MVEVVNSDVFAASSIFGESCKLADDAVLFFAMFKGGVALLSAGFVDKSGGTIPDTEHDESRSSHWSRAT